MKMRSMLTDAFEDAFALVCVPPIVADNRPAEAGEVGCSRPRLISGLGITVVTVETEPNGWPVPRLRA